MDTRTPRIQVLHCPACAYDVSSPLEHGVDRCPECGGAIDREACHPPQRSRMRNDVAIMVIVALVSGVAGALLYELWRSDPIYIALSGNTPPPTGPNRLMLVPPGPPPWYLRLAAYSVMLGPVIGTHGVLVKRVRRRVGTLHARWPSLALRGVGFGLLLVVWIAALNIARV